jgi:hypothetical protein
MKSLDLSMMISGLYWPIVVLVVAILFRKGISKVLSSRQIKLSLPNNVSVSITSEEAETTLNQLFTEFYVAYRRLLRPWHKELFDRILASKTELQVNVLIPGFDTDNDEHIGALRALRGLGLIEPRYGGSWTPESLVEVTTFGKIYVKYLKMKELADQGAGTAAQTGGSQ